MTDAPDVEPTEEIDLTDVPVITGEITPDPSAKVLNPQTDEEL